MGVTYRKVCQTFAAKSNFFSLLVYNACSHTCQSNIHAYSKTYDTALKGVASLDRSICLHLLIHALQWVLQSPGQALAVPLTYLFLKRSLLQEYGPDRAYSNLLPVPFFFLFPSKKKPLRVYI